MRMIFFFILVLSFSQWSLAQGFQACLALQIKNPSVRDPIRDILSSDFRCSIPTGIPQVFTMKEDPAQVFHSACVLHDLCYKHGSYTYGKTRRNCDEEFRDIMKNVCKARYQDQNQLLCLADSTIIFELVRRLGFIFYLSPPGFNDFPDGIEPFTNDHGRVCRYLD